MDMAFHASPMTANICTVRADFFLKEEKYLRTTRKEGTTCHPRPLTDFGSQLFILRHETRLTCPPPPVPLSRASAASSRALRSASARLRFKRPNSSYLPRRMNPTKTTLRQATLKSKGNKGTPLKQSMRVTTCNALPVVRRRLTLTLRHAMC